MLSIAVQKIRSYAESFKISRALAYRTYPGYNILY